MEPIYKAVERAKAAINPVAASHGGVGPKPRAQTSPTFAHSPGLAPVANEPALRDSGVELNWGLLESHRIIAHNTADPRSTSFHMLRTQVLQSMDQSKWQFLAVTSPTPGCGKTVTAINLALSIARQPERSVLLVDLDLQKARVAECLGLDCKQGVLSVLEGRTELADTILKARVAKHELYVLPTETPTLGTAELMSSRAMSNMLHGIRRDFPGYTVVLDLPPMLSSDDVIALLPQIDCVLLVAAVGVSTMSELKKCNGHLQATEVVRLVLNKSIDPVHEYY